MDIKKLLSNKKILLAVIAAVIVLVIIIVNMVMNQDSEKKTVSLNDKLNDLGVEFYETKYHTTLDDKAKLANFKDSGISISVTNVEVLLPLDDETAGLLKDKNCNLDETKIIIFPKAPYGVKDYSMKVELACEE